MLSDILAGARQSQEYLRSKLSQANDLSFIRDLVRSRREAGLEQTDVAQIMGVTQQAVSKIERYDGDPKLSTIRRYANAIGVVVEHHVVPDDGTGYSITTPMLRLEDLSVSAKVGPAGYTRMLHAASVSRTDFALSA